MATAKIIAPRGLLKEKVVQVLKAAGKPLSTAALRDRVMKAGYSSRDPRTLYNQIFALAKRTAEIEKKPDGFALKAATPQKKPTPANK